MERYLTHTKIESFKLKEVYWRYCSTWTWSVCAFMYLFNFSCVFRSIFERLKQYMLDNRDVILWKIYIYLSLVVPRSFDRYHSHSLPHMYNVHCEISSLPSRSAPDQKYDAHWLVVCLLAESWLALAVETVRWLADYLWARWFWLVGFRTGNKSCWLYRRPVQLYFADVY